VSWINVWWQQVSGTAAQGLQITIIGMSLVFFTLGLIILALALLTRLPGLRVKTEKQEQNAKPAKQNLSSQPAVEHAGGGPATADDGELARIAAIAVALTQSRHSMTGMLHPARQPRRQATAGNRMLHPAWKQYGRTHQLGL
jgi:Na+-transporting methylmalonyl-CoA/oxaloacetate decarboxylase gamma subunit